MATAVADFAGLLKGIPSGAWVAISEKEHKVIAFGADAQSVYTEAQNKGEMQPLIVRVPDEATTMFF